MLQPVKSSNLVAIGHDPITLTLTVVFKSQETYEYEKVPVLTFEQIIKADSVGSAFHKLIKSNPSQYPYRRVPNPVG